VILCRFLYIVDKFYLYYTSIFGISDDIKLLMARTTALSRRNCDGIFNGGVRTDGVFEIFTGYSFTRIYCEFDRGNYNWMVKMYMTYLGKG